MLSRPAKWLRVDQRTGGDRADVSKVAADVVDAAQRLNDPDAGLDDPEHRQRKGQPTGAQRMAVDDGQDQAERKPTDQKVKVARALDGGQPPDLHTEHDSDSEQDGEPCL